MAEERRRFVRLDTRLEIDYTVLPKTQAKSAVTKDIGGGGICFFADEKLKPADTLQVSMKLPGREKPVNATVEVVWSERYEVIGKTEHKSAVEVGVKFLEIAPEDQEAVMQHVILSLKPRSLRSSSPSSG